jgi:enoyl-CoA hydratase/carnithine racemase
MANYARLVALVGPQRVKEMLLLARMVDAPSALQAGLVMEVLPDAAALHARAQAVAETLAGHAPITLSTTKEAMRRMQAALADESIDDLIRQTYGSRDFREGMSAFLEKRPPKWTGR